MRTRRSSLSTACSGFLARGLLLAVVGSGACYDGPDPLEPAPGAPGGLCIEPEGACDEPGFSCDPIGRYCYDLAIPCRGVLCNGHGTCTVAKEEGLPVCNCEPGYNNFEYSLLCQSL